MIVGLVGAVTVVANSYTFVHGAQFNAHNRQAVWFVVVSIGGNVTGGTVIVPLAVRCGRWMVAACACRSAHGRATVTILHLTITPLSVRNLRNSRPSLVRLHGAYSSFGFPHRPTDVSRHL